MHLVFPYEYISNASDEIQPTVMHTCDGYLVLWQRLPATWLLLYPSVVNNVARPGEPFFKLLVLKSTSLLYVLFDRRHTKPNFCNIIYMMINFIDIGQIDIPRRSF